MRWPYRCRECGAYLDPDEKCDCEKEKADGRQPERLRKTSKDVNINNNIISEEDLKCQH